MALIPNDEIERLKKEISIQRLAEARGIKLRRSGKELIGLCPFHDDRNPSLSIDPVKNVWDCKGACGEGVRTTQIYTQVAIRALQQIHAATHPAEAHAALLAAQRSAVEREGLLAALEADTEADEEAGG